MDARQRLRQYLEERRDLGESEFLLDTMSVDEVLRAIGAITGGPAQPEAVDEPPDRTARAGWRGVVAAPVDAAYSSREPKLTPTADDDTGTDRTATGRSNPDIVRIPTLESIADEVESCQRCPLFKTATRGVPGDGPSNARLVCVGEAPGANEDLTGHPFVGAAGNLLTKILAAVDLRREEVFITNVVKHRPPGNRNPAPHEIEACNPYLVRQLELIQPKVIVAFGTFAAQTLLSSKTPIGKLRGEVHRYHGIPLIVTYHPAALLRNPAWKRPTWEDVKLARRILDSTTGT